MTLKNKILFTIFITEPAAMMSTVWTTLNFMEGDFSQNSIALCIMSVLMLVLTFLARLIHHDVEYKKALL